MAEKDKKYYWLKLKKDFFKSQEAMLLERFGSEHLLFYIKLLCESLEYDGELRFSESVPYTADMLAITTGTDKKVAENTIQLLTELEMIDVKEDETIVMKTLKDMVGHETYWAKKKREQKEREEKEREEKELKEKQKEEKKTKPKAKRFVPPTVEQVRQYCDERNNKIDAEKFVDYYESKGWKVGKDSKMKDWKACVRTWERNNFESDRTAKKFNNETPRDYDMDELEKMLLSSN